jgi:hypothetical protein
MFTSSSYGTGNDTKELDYYGGEVLTLESTKSITLSNKYRVVSIYKFIREKDGKFIYRLYNVSTYAI